MSKGSAQRPCDPEKFAAGWERIWGEKPQELGPPKGSTPVGCPECGCTGGFVPLFSPPDLYQCVRCNKEIKITTGSRRNA